MKQFVKKYWLVIFLAFLASLLAIIKWTSQAPAIFPKVISLEPLPGAISSPVSQVKIVFSQSTADQLARIQVKITPSVNFEKIVADDQLKINFLPPLEQGSYFFEIWYQEKQLYSWSYKLPEEEEEIISPQPTAKISPFQEISPTPLSGAGNPREVEEIVNRLIRYYPLIKYLPFENNDFAANYLGPLKLGVKIKGQDKTRIKQEVLDWIQDKGVDPGIHEIVWQ